MWFQIVDKLNAFARENTFLSLIILAIAGNIATDLFKWIGRRAARGGMVTVTKWNRKNIEFLLTHYQEERIRVAKIREKDIGELYLLLYELYTNIALFFIFLIIYFVLVKINNGYAFYAFLGAGAKTLFQIVGNTAYNLNLFEKAKKFEKFELKTNKKISSIRKVLGLS